MWDWQGLGICHFLMERIGNSFFGGNLADSIKTKKYVSFDTEILLLRLDPTEILTEAQRSMHKDVHFSLF